MYHTKTYDHNDEEVKLGAFLYSTTYCFQQHLKSRKCIAYMRDLVDEDVETGALCRIRNGVISK